MLDSLRTRSAAIVAPAAADHEAQLVAQAKRDRQAFARLYDRYVAAIYRYCHAGLGDPEAAADATSVVFVKALSALPSCQDDAFRSWLFAIAHNVIADTLRARRPDQPLQAAADLVDLAPSPEEITLAAESQRSLTALLARLPTEQRHVVELRLAGLTGPEIARALGRSHASVRIIQFRAYARLRALIGHTNDSEEPRHDHR